MRLDVHDHREPSHHTKEDTQSHGKTLPKKRVSECGIRNETLKLCYVHDTTPQLNFRPKRGGDHLFCEYIIAKLRPNLFSQTMQCVTGAVFASHVERFATT
eukprot:2582930-Amphidinium_carterae.1